MTTSSSSVRHHEIEARSITRSGSGTDPWFLGRFGANLYRGCEHGCLYCDGRAERYRVEGDFARDVQVKVNALDLLEQELARAREPGFVFVGGGVCDAWQPAEAKYRLARGVLELALRLRRPVHVLTKSALVERDLDLLERIHAERRAVLSFSIATLDERLLPGLSDQPEQIDALVARAAASGVRFVCFAGLTLRPGIQQATYLEALAEQRPELLPGYQTLYRAQRKSGAPDPRYSERLYHRCQEALNRHGMPGRAPRDLFAGLVPTYAEVAVQLEHADAASGDGPGALTEAGWAIQRWAQQRLAHLRGPRAYREVEAAFEVAIRTGALAGELGLSPEIQERVTRLLEQAGAGSLRP